MKNHIDRTLHRVLSLTLILALTVVAYAQGGSVQQQFDVNIQIQKMINIYNELLVQNEKRK
jgi:hypothetical protein